MKTYSIYQLRQAWAAGKHSKDSQGGIENESVKVASKDPVPAQDGLIGKWFHTYEENGMMKWQGQVLSAHTGDKFLVQLYSWFDGYPTDQKLIDIDKMESWTFYDDNELMIDAYRKAKERGIAL